MDDYRSILQRYWGYGSFRPLQEDIIRSVCEGKDTLGLMPTGGGKSVTFQVPALAAEGICVVVTPLIALMKDQTDNLRRMGIKATAVYSGMSRLEIITQLENCIFGDYKFLYISPERLGSELFQAKLMAMNVSLLVVDESHCISQWGYDFRPSYLAIAEVRKLLPGVPVLALTATATPDVINDIQEKLLFKRKNVFLKSFARPNLAYVVRRTDDKDGQLVHLLKRTEGTAIVYVRNRRRTQELSEMLRREGISADFFHAGLKREEKDVRQNRWKNDECRVIVSTNAFGMGIDKPDVRLVVHFDMPGSLEEYYQEAGRAGRDEARAYAVALCSGVDDGKLKRRMSDEFPDKDFIGRVYEALGNFYQIAAGFGLDTVHDFSLGAFCAAYHFPMLQVHHALKILELSGYIEYVEEADNRSRLVFSVTRDELYKYRHQDKRTDELIQTLLRYHTGIFTEYAYIDESLIANYTGMTRHEVYNMLTGLSKFRIVNYIPRKKTPLIIYTRSREELHHLRIPRSAYEERRERFEHRLTHVLAYTGNSLHCRSRMLLSYFHEKDARDCGVCDICRARNESGLTNYELNTIRSLLEEGTSAGAVAVDELIRTFPFPMETSVAAVRFLSEHGGRAVLKEGMCVAVSD
ncbi:ATP-dependent DNA helicase recQ [Bacteroidales bacterium Barb4]|nr:ATP-dependent DNA helicase recQ [Bacteroidales bacterium Barb4]